MKYTHLFISALSALLFIAQAQAGTSEYAIEEAPGNGIIHPVESQMMAGETDGERFLSIRSDILPSATTTENPEPESVESSPLRWSYSRGVGKIPSVCESGYDKAGALCYEQCPSGYDTVAGVCWQQCPEGYKDIGAFCMKSLFSGTTKHSFMQNISTPSCPAGKNEEAGLCYEPCEGLTTGLGALCVGLFGGQEDQDTIRNQVAAEHARYPDNTSGIILEDDQIPQLKTDFAFTPIVCAIEESTDDLPLPGADEVATFGADYGLRQLTKGIGGAWFMPSVSNTVLFHFTADTTCEDNGTIATANLKMDASVTVPASTALFDPVLHNLAGADLGVASISVYELIPFRIYGIAGTTLGMEADIESTINRNLPPLDIDGKRYAHETALTITPSSDFWLALETSLRLPSFLNFLPDFLQLGVEFRTYLLELTLPYRMAEGVRESDEGTELFKEESLSGTLASGRGKFGPFFRLWGVKQELFPEHTQLEWDGFYEGERTFFENSTSTSLPDYLITE